MTIYIGNVSLEAGAVKPTNPVCVHYWMIDSQSVGRCKKCSEVKDFEKLRRELGRNYSRGNRRSPVSNVVHIGE